MMMSFPPDLQIHGWKFVQVHTLMNVVCQETDIAEVELKVRQTCMWHLHRIVVGCPSFCGPEFADRTNHKEQLAGW